MIFILIPYFAHSNASDLIWRKEKSKRSIIQHSILASIVGTRHVVIVMTLESGLIIKSEMFDVHSLALVRFAAVTRRK